MDEQLVTVYRSADPTAQEQVEEVRDLLAEAGLSPEVFGDDAVGVPEGAWEVRVPASQADRADRLLSATAPEALSPGDPSDDLDTETIFSAVSATAEMEAIGLRNVLEANGISTVLVGTSVTPNLRFEVRVAKGQADLARRVLAEAEAAGPAAAEEAERAAEE